MIVITQDEENYINSDSVVKFSIKKFPCNEKGFIIEVDTIDDCRYTLGMYETEERAKEIMNILLSHECIFRMPNEKIIVTK